MVENPSKPLPPAVPPKSSVPVGGGDLNVLLRGNRLEISADVDLAGLQKLKQILTKYEEILALIGPDVSQFL